MRISIFIALLLLAGACVGAETNYPAATEYYIYQNVTTNLKSVANKWAITMLPDGTMKRSWTIQGHARPSLAWLDTNMAAAITWKDAYAKNVKAKQRESMAELRALVQAMNNRFKRINAVLPAVTNITRKEMLYRIEQNE